MKEYTPIALRAHDLAFSLLRFQKALGWVVMLVFVAAMGSLVDGLTAEMQRGPNRLDVLPNSVTPLSGPIPVKKAELEDFQVQGNAPDGQVKLELDDFFASYWFGSGMWRGRLVVGHNPGIGEYHMVVEFADAPARAAQNYRVVVWGDTMSLQQGSFSRITRETGFSPFWAAGYLFPVGLVGALINFFMGRSRAKTLLHFNCSEIHKIVRGKQAGLEVSFGLGEQHGVFVGQMCEIMRPDATVVARGSVMLCEWRYSSILLPLDTNVQASDVVRLLNDSEQKAPRSLTRSGAPLAPKGVLHE